jgi:hypothetical protein
MGYRLDDWGSILVIDKRFFSSSQHPDKILEPAQSSIHWVLGALSPGGKADDV